MFIWIRQHWIITTIGIVVVIAVGGAVYKSKTASKSTIVTAPVERRNLEQVVSVVGTVDVAERVKLSARRSGPLVAIRHKVSDHVSANDVIVEMKSTDEQIALQQVSAQLKKAQADLQLRLAGESKESLESLAATTQQRVVELNKAQDDLVSAHNDQQITIKTQQQLVVDARMNVKLAAQSSITTASGALNDADGILGVDIETANQAFRDNLAVKDPSAMITAKERYRAAQAARYQASTALSVSTPQEAAVSVDFLLDRTSDLLTSVSRVLETSVTNDAFPPATLSAKQSTIATDRTAINTVQTTLQSKLQAYDTAKLTQESQLNSAASAITAKQNAVLVAQAALENAKAAEQVKRVPPRAVDIAALEALVAQAQSQVSQAQQAIEDAMIRTPIDGVIADIPVNIGEVVAVNQTVVEVLGGRLEITANVPEVDIGKITVGQKATMTLDAFGAGEKLVGTVVSIDPAQTVIEGVATYTVTLQFEKENSRIKPGMTANIDMVTARRDNTLVIPQRAVRTVAGKMVVKVRSGVTVSEVPVSVGLIGSDGFVEVLFGLQEGQAVVVSGE